MAASHPACPAPTTTTSKCSVKGIRGFYCSNQRTTDVYHGQIPRAAPTSFLPLPVRKLRPSDVSESSFLPLIGWEVPVAGAGFVIVSAESVGDRRGTPIVHAHLQQGPRRNLDAGFDCAAFEVPGWQRGSRRGAPEVPNAIATLADWEHDCVIRCVMGHRHWVVLIGGKPRVTPVKSAANGATVVVQDYVFAIDFAG